MERIVEVVINSKNTDSESVNLLKHYTNEFMHKDYSYAAEKGKPLTAKFIANTLRPNVVVLLNEMVNYGINRCPVEIEDLLKPEHINTTSFDDLMFKASHLQLNHLYDGLAKFACNLN